MFRAETISESPHGTTSEKVNRNESFVNAPGFVAFLLGVGALVGFAITTTRAHPNFVPLFDTWIYSFPGAAASVFSFNAREVKLDGPSDGCGAHSLSDSQVLPSETSSTE
jgi:hypothetical protein